MKVLHVGEYVSGGVLTYLNELLKKQDEDPSISQIRVLASRYNSGSFRDFKKGKVLYYSYKRKFVFFVKAIHAIRKSIREFQPDLIHAHSSFAGFFCRMLYIFSRKRPLVIYCSHGWSFLMDAPEYKKKMYALLERLLATQTDVIVNISHNELKASIERGIPANKSIVIYNGISEEPNIIDSEPINLNVDSNVINILFVGRFDKQKGIDILLNFMEQYEFPGIRLYLIGDTILNDNPVDIPDHVTALGLIDHSNIDAYYQMFDAVIIPSRWEGFGLVAIEAMKNKKAVIASNKGALPEIVVEGETGYIFDLDNLSTLKTIFDRLDKSILYDLGQNGYRRYLSMFTSDKMYGQLSAVYRKLSNKRSEGLKLREGKS